LRSSFDCSRALAILSMLLASFDSSSSPERRIVVSIFPSSATFSTMLSSRPMRTTMRRSASMNTRTTKTAVRRMLDRVKKALTSRPLAKRCLGLVMARTMLSLPFALGNSVAATIALSFMGMMPQPFSSISMAPRSKGAPALEL